jgi:hypothetical protein
LNITVCGDGLNPSSGYSFVVGGYNNTRSQILRGNKVIAETDRPEARFEKTINHNMRWHRRWVYIRGEARRAQENGQNGVRLTLTVDDTELLTYFDPQPLPLWEKGGRVAFWTVDGTLMIARAKIECEKPGLKSLPSGLIDPLAVPAPAAKGAFSPAPVTVDGLPTAIVTADGSGWRVVNPGSGGWFETKWNNQPLEIGLDSKLSFDIQMQPDVHIDAYVKIGEDLYLMELNGDQRPDAMAPSLGKMRLTPKTDGWQTASFDLGAALAKRFPGQKHWTVQSLNLGAVHGDYYRLVGFAGNSYGTAYRVTGMKLEGSPLS